MLFVLWKSKQVKSQQFIKLLMADFNSLRVFFSAEDEGAQDLTELEFLKLNREDAENLIKHVKNAKNRSHLQEIYDTAHPLLLQGKFYIDFMMLSNTFLDLLNISCCDFIRMRFSFFNLILIQCCARYLTR